MGKNVMKVCLIVVLLVTLPSVLASRTQPLIVDHNCTDITLIPEEGINQAKETLHIAYGTTSHGSQLWYGMVDLIGFANGGGLELSLPTDIFMFNAGGTSGALDLRTGVMAGDAGYYPQWVNETRSYLDANPDINVIIWSWCGQADDKYVAGTLDSEYLTPMSQLEMDYPAVMFVYMTGHMEHSSDANIKAANQMIRDYCINNNKVLYDFADIECYDPDDTFYEFPNDNCDYYSSATGTLLGNWAVEWQTSHTEDVDWYSCNAPHTEPLNANLKAYAAWWLWVSLSGYQIPTGAGDRQDKPGNFALGQNCPNPFNPITRIEYHVPAYAEISLGVYDVRGLLVTMLVAGPTEPGTYTVSWDGTDGKGQRVGSGVYFYRLTSGQYFQSRKMVLLE